MNMYGRAMPHEESATYRSDKGRRKSLSSLHVGDSCVIRIRAEHGERFALEYSGVIRKNDEGEYTLETKRTTGEKVHIPLLLGKDNMLMSPGVRPQGERSKESPENKSGGVAVFRPTPAFPSRPIGYVLDESFAKPAT